MTRARWIQLGELVVIAGLAIALVVSKRQEASMERAQAKLEVQRANQCDAAGQLALSDLVATLQRARQGSTEIHGFELVIYARACAPLSPERDSVESAGLRAAEAIGSMLVSPRPGRLDQAAALLAQLRGTPLEDWPTIDIPVMPPPGEDR